MIKYTCMQNIKIMAGAGCHKNVGEALANDDYTKAFVVFDKVIGETGIASKVIESLDKAGIEHVEFNKVLPDPPADIVNEGGTLCIESGCDCVIGIGGGSAIDTAKGINILRVNGGSILDFADPEAEMKKSPGLMGIPTTSGTGSELSNGLIITDAANNTKAAILAVNGMSEYAVIDPEFTTEMPKGLTVLTGLDIFSHAMEGFTSILGDDMTDIINHAIMQNVVEYLPQAADDGQNIEVRTKLHMSASLGGWMLANSSTHVGHSIAHVLGGEFHIPHGACCVYSVPAILRMMKDAKAEKVREIGRVLGASFDGAKSNEEIVETTIEAYERLAYERLGVKRIAEYMPQDAVIDIPQLAQRVVNEPLAALTPVQVTQELAENLLRDIFHSVY